MPPKRFEGKFGIPPSHPVESLLTQSLYRLPESISPDFIENLTSEIATTVDARRSGESQPVLSDTERQTLALKLARHYEDNGESAKIDIPTFIDALVESPRFLQSDKGSVEKLFEIHEMKTLQKIAELRRKRAEITAGDTSELNPYENLFETESGTYYLARLLNMPHLETESTYMTHCVGTSTSYINKMKRGEVEIFSFRDTETHEPVVTIEYDTHTHQLLQVKAQSNDIPNLSFSFAPELLEALERLPLTVNDNGESRTIESNEVAHLKRLTALEEKVSAREELTRDDLFFLYEINEPIQGFDSNEREPLIDELLETRDRKADIITIADCAPQHLATDFIELDASTEVYYEDTGSQITLCDFHEEKNKNKLPQLLELAEKLKEVNSPARPDLSFEGGIVSLSISPEIQEQLKDWNTAKVAYAQADNASPSRIYGELKNIPWLPLIRTSLDVLVLNHGETSPQERDALVMCMEKAGYRPLIISELMALGISRPDLNKSNEVLYSYEIHMLNDWLRAPYLSDGEGERLLLADDISLFWGESSRFLFVHK